MVYNKETEKNNADDNFKVVGCNVIEQNEPEGLATYST